MLKFNIVIARERTKVYGSK